MLATLPGQITARLWAVPEAIEAQALAQLRHVAALPWVAHLAVMPDVHFGIGAAVGTVIGMRGAVSPAAVGVDIGCGMAAVRTNLRAADLPDDLRRLRAQIERDIPVGFAAHDTPVTSAESWEGWGEFTTLDPRVQGLLSKARRQLGSLGGGNHFIELCLDEEERLWMMLHSGSRHIGKELAELHIARARGLLHNATLPDRDLAVFLAGTPEMEAYRRDLYWAQRYARHNRTVMLELLTAALQRFFAHLAVDTAVTCHHNYVAEETHFGEALFVTRKGAIRARQGELGIIPGSMGTKSYIVRGRGSPDSLESASHGAGRRMSRGEAKRRFSRADLEAQTAGVECRKDKGVLDEIPAAYKDIDQVMASQDDLVEVVHVLKQVLCVKG